jgi:lysophospholipase L1-like esterase
VASLRQIAAVKGPLSYDRKVLQPAGLALMQGLRNGLDQGYGAVLSDVAAMAGGINAQLSGGIGSLGTLNPGGLAARLPASAAQTAAAISGAPAPVTYVTVKIGDTELRGIVDTQVESTNREVARVVGAGAGR